MQSDRRQEAHRIRVEAAGLARDRAPVIHSANGDEQRYAGANYAMSFTKWLRHDATTGLIVDREDFERFRRAIDEGFIDPFTARVWASPDKARAWEAPTAGIVYELFRYPITIDGFVDLNFELSYYSSHNRNGWS